MTPASLLTRRLVLRPPRLDDAEAIFAAYSSDPEVTRWLLWRSHADVAETRAFMPQVVGAAREWHFLITLAGAPIGMISGLPSRHAAEVGYVLSRAHWSQGYMTEALTAMIGFAFSYPDIRRVFAYCDTENRASARVMEKSGMRLEGLLRRHTVFPNVSPEPRDVFCFAITR
jgi:RimJ/RimL family protein N-acetyltransferase